MIISIEEFRKKYNKPNAHKIDSGGDDYIIYANELKEYHHKINDEYHIEVTEEFLILNAEITPPYYGDETKPYFYEVSVINTRTNSYKDYVDVLTLDNDFVVTPYIPALNDGVLRRILIKKPLNSSGATICLFLLVYIYC